MGTRSSQRFVSRSSPYHHRLSDGIHKVPSSFTLWPCEMTDLSPTGFLHHQQHQPTHAQHHAHHQQHTHQHTYQQHAANMPSSSSGASHSSSARAPPIGSGGGRLFSYFGNEHDHERKKSETSFFNLGFRRKSTVVYYAATD